MPVGELTASIKLHDELTPTLKRITDELNGLEADGEFTPIDITTHNDKRRRLLQFWTGGRILRRHIERMHELTEHDIAEAKAGRMPERFLADEAHRAYIADIDRKLLESIDRHSLDLRGDAKALEEIAELEALFALEPDGD
jgi:hypothetical protein